MKLNFGYLLIILVVCSCNPAKYIYFREPKKPIADSVFYPTHKTDYKLQPGDIIYLEFKSSLSESTEYFDFSENGTSNAFNIGSQTTGSMYLSQYVVDDDGEILIPEIGYLKISDHTIPEIKEIIQTEARKKIQDVIVKVKLVSYEITFLGEFGHPGKILFYKDHVSLIDALAAAGEVTFYGDKQHVRVMRQTADGIYTYRLNLNDKNLLTSEKFYLKPGDVVYADPLPRKIFRTNAGDYAIVLATITSTMAFIYLIISLQNKN
jgi:polysaccharide biosynthesis/export protein